MLHHVIIANVTAEIGTICQLIIRVNAPFQLKHQVVYLLSAPRFQENFHVHVHLQYLLQENLKKEALIEKALKGRALKGPA